MGERCGAVAKREGVSLYPVRWQDVSNTDATLIEVRSRSSALTRRAALALVGASACSATAAAAAVPPRGPRRIDVHHHFQIPGLRSLNPWSLSRDLDDMDRSGTAVAMLSNFIPDESVPQEQQRANTRRNNDYGARLCADHPTRFGQLATMPLRHFDNDGALREMAYALDTLKADGFRIRTSYGDGWLGDPRWTPVYEELDRRRAVVLVHPDLNACCTDLTVARSVPNEAPMLEYATDTGRAVASWTFGGGASRYPNIRWIFSHAGGTMPVLIERFFQNGASAQILPGIVTKGQDGARRGGAPSLTGEEVLRRLRSYHYDTAQASNPVAMRALKAVVGTSQILFGTDVWYRTTLETARGLDTCGVFTPAELAAVDRGNALRLFPRLA